MDDWLVRAAKRALWLDEDMSLAEAKRPAAAIPAGRECCGRSAELARAAQPLVFFSVA